MRINLDTTPIMMLDGMAVGKMTVIAAMGISRNGQKQMLGLSTGGTGNQEAVKELLAGLLDWELTPDVTSLFILDGTRSCTKR
ncbi:hypothetical protein ACRQV7_00810 [Caproiciproducens sp. R2]|uniref:hypothetical protein n=1 Tax=Caproiciproducens sp. R2 TaxID=3435187 RepID=UPI004033EE75